MLVVNETCARRLPAVFCWRCDRGCDRGGGGGGGGGGGCLIPIQLFIGWYNRAGNGNTRHLGLVIMITHTVLLSGLGLRLGLGLRNTHLNCRRERVFRDSFDAYNVVNQVLCFFQIISDPILRGLLLLLLPTCGYQCS